MKSLALAAAALVVMATARPAAGQLAVADGPQIPIVLDAHFLDSMEYLIAPDELQWNGDYVAVGLLASVPSTSLRGRMQFLVVGQGGGWQAGDRVWTNQFYRTRPANKSDLAVGKLVFCFSEMENGVYRAPRSRTEALYSGWFATTITDVSMLDRNEVRAGRSRLSVSCLRVLE